MFISKLQLDPKKRETARALQNRGILHTAFENSVEGKRPHVLWRLEPDMSILAISNEIPYLGDIQVQFGNDMVKPSCKPYEPYLDTICTGDLMRFRVTVNPVINKSDGSKNGKDVPLNLRRTKNYPFCAEDWIIKKLEERGASVCSIRDIGHETSYFLKEGRRIPIFIVSYSGLLNVIDADLLKDAMREGIGGKKTYGCGLLTAIRITS